MSNISLKEVITNLKKEYKDSIELPKYIKANILNGKYHPLSFEYYNNIEDYKKDTVYFYIMTNNNDELILGVFNGSIMHSNGHILATLSDIYKVLYKIFDEPNIYYTLLYDNAYGQYLKWNLFDDKELNEVNDENTFIKYKKLIEIQNNNNHLKKAIKNTIELPYELYQLVIDNYFDYIKYKNIINIKSDELKLIKKF